MTKSFRANTDDERADVSMRHLRCVSCSGVPGEPVECDCCGALYCKGCQHEVADKGQCAACHRLNPTLRSSVLASKLISGMGLDCPACGQRVIRSGLTAHAVKCPRRRVKCVYRGCGFECGACELRDHLILVHIEQWVEERIALSPVGP